MTDRNTRRKSGTAVNKSRATAAPVPKLLPLLTDRRAIESLLQAFGGGEADDAVTKAQDIMYDAWDADSKRRRVALARKALKISPLCADAYVLLAQEVADHLDEEIELYRKGVDAGERALGAAAFRDDVGHFWGLLETRPYMRARCGLAMALWQKGELDAAIAHVQDMLRLNPNDNQGMRYILLAWLLARSRQGDAESLMRRYKNDHAPQWQYTAALLEFRRAGDAETSRKRLAAALRGNPHVPAYLLGKKISRSAPAYLTVGGDDEAQEFAREFLAGWRETPGALEWLAVQTGPLGAVPVAGCQQ
jgi:tetratricopeptide (TPR) repeat protein